MKAIVLVGVSVLGASILAACSGGDAESLGETTGATASALEASGGPVSRADFAAAKGETYGLVDFVCDAPSTVFAVKVLGAGEATAEGNPAGVAAALTRWDRAAGRVLQTTEGASVRSGAASLAWTFTDVVAPSSDADGGADADAGPSTLTTSVTRVNLLAPAGAGRTTYGGFVSRASDAGRERITCRNPERVALQCLTASRSAYVTRNATTNALELSVFDLGATAATVSATDGVVTESCGRKVVAFPGGHALQLPSRGPVTLVLDGRRERCSVVTLGQDGLAP